MLHAPRTHSRSGRLLRRVVALLQIVVMLVLAIPACAGDSSSAADGTVKVASAEAAATPAGVADSEDCDDCPCCPDDEGAAPGDCSSCSFCWDYPPVNAPAPSLCHLPAVDQLIHFETTKPLPEVFLSIFIPPQNLA